jgi:hypothetical protein
MDGADLPIMGVVENTIKSMKSGKREILYSGLPLDEDSIKLVTAYYHQRKHHPRDIISDGECFLLASKTAIDDDHIYSQVNQRNYIKTQGREAFAKMVWKSLVLITTNPTRKQFALAALKWVLTDFPPEHAAKIYQENVAAIKTVSMGSARELAEFDITKFHDTARAPLLSLLASRYLGHSLVEILDGVKGSALTQAGTSIFLAQTNRFHLPFTISKSSGLVDDHGVAIQPTELANCPNDSTILLMDKLASESQLSLWSKEYKKSVIVVPDTGLYKMSTGKKNVVGKVKYENFKSEKASTLKKLSDTLAPMTLVTEVKQSGESSKPVATVNPFANLIKKIQEEDTMDEE